MPLSHVLGSIHYQVGDYRKLFYTGDVFSYQELYFDHLALSAESGLFDTLAHPDLIKNESPADWDFERLRPVIERALDRIAATGVAMELNTSGVQKATAGNESLALATRHDARTRHSRRHRRGRPCSGTRGRWLRRAPLLQCGGI